MTNGKEKNDRFRKSKHNVLKLLYTLHFGGYTWKTYVRIYTYYIYQNILDGESSNKMKHCIKRW